MHVCRHLGTTWAGSRKTWTMPGQPDPGHMSPFQNGQVQHKHKLDLWVKDQLLSCMGVSVCQRAFRKTMLGNDRSYQWRCTQEGVPERSSLASSKNWASSAVLFCISWFQLRPGKEMHGAKVNAYSVLYPHLSLWSLGSRTASCRHTILRYKAQVEKEGHPENTHWLILPLTDTCTWLQTSPRSIHYRCSPSPFFGGRFSLAKCSWKDTSLPFLKGNLLVTQVNCTCPLTFMNDCN